MWVVVYMVQGKIKAQKVLDILSNEGILVKIQAIKKNNDEEEGYYEILVPESEAEEAHVIICENGM